MTSKLKTTGISIWSAPFSPQSRWPNLEKSLSTCTATRAVDWKVWLTFERPSYPSLACSCSTFQGLGTAKGSMSHQIEGFHQSKDIQTVVQFIRKENPNITICLWGRSMGAAATIKFLQEDHDIQLAILDSPFSSVRELAMELGRNKTVLPQIFVPLLLSYLKSIIKERAQFDIDDLDLTQVVKNIKVPAIFLSCQRDELVPFKQSETLFNLYSAPKQLLIIQEEHNQPRKKQTIQRVFKAIQKEINRSMVLTEESGKKKPKLKKKLHLTCSHRQLNMARYSVPISDSCSIKLGSKPASRGTQNDLLPVARSTVDLSLLPQTRVKRQIIQINVRPFKATKKVESIHKSQLKNLPTYMTKSCQHVENEKTLKSIDDAPHKPLALEDITYMKHRNTIHHLVDRDNKQPVPRNTWIKRRKNFKPSSNKENTFK